MDTLPAALLPLGSALRQARPMWSLQLPHPVNPKAGQTPSSAGSATSPSWGWPVWCCSSLPSCSRLWRMLPPSSALMASSRPFARGAWLRDGCSRAWQCSQHWAPFWARPQGRARWTSSPSRPSCKRPSGSCCWLGSSLPWSSPDCWSWPGRGRPALDIDRSERRRSLARHGP